jgi:hypothetical protein
MPTAQQSGKWANFNDPTTTGAGYAEDQARKQGYQGTFFAPQNYADSAGQNFAKATNILQGGFSGQGQETTDYQNALRGAAMERIQGLGKNAEQNKARLKADLEQGFANQANILRRSAAGTGAGASLGYGRAAGDLASKFQQNLAGGLLDIDNQSIDRLGALGGIGNNLFQQQLLERQNQYNQAQDLSNMYNDWSGVEAGRGAAEQAAAAQATAARKAAQAQLINQILQTGGTVAGASMGAPKKTPQTGGAT